MKKIILILLLLPGILVADIFTAFQEGDKEKVIEYINDGNDVNIKGPQDITPLMAASVMGYLEIAELLIDKGAEVNYQVRGFNALTLACRMNYTDIAKLLLENNSKVNIVSFEGHTPLYFSLEYDNKEVFDLLIAYGADVNLGNESLLLKSLKMDDYYVNVLLSKGVNPNVTNEDGSTPLMYAVRKNNKGMINKLLELGADINIVNEYGSTAASIAFYDNNIELGKLLFNKKWDSYIISSIFWSVSREGYFEILDFLIENNADINYLNDSYNQTALMYASERDHKQLYNYLIENGADLDVKNNDGDTALLTSIKDNSFYYITKLIEDGADITIKNNSGLDAMALAMDSYYYLPDVQEQLIKGGVNVNSKNSYGDTPLIQAVRNRKNNFIDIFIELGADVSIPNNAGNTAFMEAISLKNLSIAEKLLNHEADFETVNNQGETALIIATKIDDQEVIEFLLEKGAKDTIEEVYRNISTYIIENNIEKVNEYITKGYNIDHKGSNGIPILMQAVASDRLEIVKLILENGAYINCTDNNEATPIMYASYLNLLDIAKLLLDLDVSLRKTDKNKSTPLMYAASMNSYDVAKLLLDNDVNLEDVDSFNKTALNYAIDTNSQDVIGLFFYDPDYLLDTFIKAIEADDIEIIQITLDYGIDLYEDYISIASLFTAIKHRKIEVLDYLIKSGVKINAQNLYGKTPLFYAAELGRKECAKMLLDAGADLSLADNNGDTPRRIAVINSYKEVAEMLVGEE